MNRRKRNIQKAFFPVKNAFSRLVVRHAKRRVYKQTPGMLLGKPINAKSMLPDIGIKRTGKSKWLVKTGYGHKAEKRLRLLIEKLRAKRENILDSLSELHETGLSASTISSIREEAKIKTAEINSIIGFLERLVAGDAKTIEFSSRPDISQLLAIEEKKFIGKMEEDNAKNTLQKYFKSGKFERK